VWEAHPAGQRDHQISQDQDLSQIPNQARQCEPDPRQSDPPRVREIGQEPRLTPRAAGTGGGATPPHTAINLIYPESERLAKTGGQHNEPENETERRAKTRGDHKPGNARQSLDNQIRTESERLAKNEDQG
jgi:hypothetical protein